MRLRIKDLELRTMENVPVIPIGNFRKAEIDHSS